MTAFQVFYVNRYQVQNERTRTGEDGPMPCCEGFMHCACFAEEEIPNDLDLPILSDLNLVRERICMMLALRFDLRPLHVFSVKSCDVSQWCAECSVSPEKG